MPNGLPLHYQKASRYHSFQRTINIQRRIPTALGAHSSNLV